MKKYIPEIIGGIILSFLLLLAIAYFQLKQTFPDPKTDLSDYPEIRNGIKPEYLVEHFPEKIPMHKKAYFYYTPGILQGDTDFQLLVEFKSDKGFKSEKERILKIADTSGTFEGLSTKFEVFVSIMVPQKMMIKDFPLILLFNIDQVPAHSLRHDGAAIDEKTKTIFYWFRDV
jgi:hypothetical protein